MSPVSRVAAGLAGFRNLRDGGFAFADKTRYAAELALAYHYRLLVRPRRFGKTLLLDTVQCLHERREVLFRGTEAYALVDDWSEEAKVPVVRFDLSAANTAKGPSVFERRLQDQVLENARRIGVMYPRLNRMSCSRIF